MNKEEALQYGRLMLSLEEDKESAMYDFIVTAVKALEQEPVLDKIRAEIADIYCGQYCENPFTADAVREMALDIIDKYTEEGSEKWAENGTIRQQMML